MGPGSQGGGVGVVNGGHVMTTGNKFDDRRMTSARRANAVSAARRISSMANLQQVREHSTHKTLTL